MEMKEIKRKIIVTGIAFIIFVIFCIIAVSYAKVNTEKMKTPSDVDVQSLYDY